MSTLHPVNFRFGAMTDAGTSKMWECKQRKYKVEVGWLARLFVRAVGQDVILGR